MEYYEYNACNPKNNTSGGKIFISLKKTAVILILVSITLILILLPWNYEGLPTGLSVFYNILIICLIELPLTACYFIFNKLSKRYFEYDYFILGEVLKIVKILNKVTRKSVLEVNLSDIENIGIYKSGSYECAAASAVKEKSFACNQTGEFYLYILALSEGKRELYITEYDFGFVSALRKAMKRETVFDKDLLLVLRQTQKKLNINEIDGKEKSAENFNDCSAGRGNETSDKTAPEA